MVGRMVSHHQARILQRNTLVQLMVMFGELLDESTIIVGDLLDHVPVIVWWIPGKTEMIVQGLRRVDVAIIGVDLVTCPCETIDIRATAPPADLGNDR